MKFYVATAYRSREAAKEAIAAVRQAGHEITYDWTRDEEPPFTSDDERLAFLEECGLRDYHGVMACDALIVLAHPDMRDTRVEFGIALGRCVPVFVVDSWRVHSVFYGAPGVQRVADVQHAIEASKTYVRTFTPDTDRRRLGA